MVLNTWRFTTIMLATSSMAMAVWHLTGMPRLGWVGSLWLHADATGNAFRILGGLGAAIDAGAWIAAGVLAFLARRRPPAVFRLTVAGAACLAAAFAALWAFVVPVNAEIAAWTPDTVPFDWSNWRARWEFAHAGRAALLLAGLGAIILSVAVETPLRDPSARRMPHRAVGSGRSGTRPAV